MKQINIRLNIKYILFIISYLKFYTNCFTCEEDCKRDGDTCANKNSYSLETRCPSDCKPNLLNANSDKCYTCTGGSGNYYSFSNDISGTCTKVSSCSVKTIYEKKQCVSSCGSYLYEMGKYCYFDCTGGNREEVYSSTKKCKCRYLYYIQSNEYICLDQNKYCESNHHSYDYETKLCSTNTTCGSKKTYEFHRDGDTVNFKRCSSTCLDTEFLESTGSNNCVKSCPLYYTEDIITKQKICISTCSSPNVVNVTKCVNSAECKYFNDYNSALPYCLNECASPYYINGDKRCSTTCKDTTTYYSEKTNDNTCLNSCPSRYYKNVSGNKTCLSVKMLKVAFIEILIVLIIDYVIPTDVHPVTQILNLEVNNVLMDVLPILLIIKQMN